LWLLIDDAYATGLWLESRHFGPVEPNGAFIDVTQPGNRFEQQA